MSNEISENKVLYKIAEYRLEELQVALDKLNKRADKLGCPHVGFVVHKTYMVHDPYFIAEYCKEVGHMPSDDVIAQFPLIKMCDVEILGEGPKIEGYKFIGTLDHYTIPGQVIVQSVPGENVPPQFYHSEAICDHCNKIRNRVETFVVENEETGEYLQVGRKCLRDFFGHDPQAIARFLTRMMSFVDGLGDDTWSGREPRSGDYTYFDKIEVLRITSAVIRTFGWVPRSMANEERTATSNHVSYALFPSFGYAEREAKRRFIESLKFDAEKDLEEANAAIAWLREQNSAPENSYFHNLMLVDQSDTVPAKMIGYWCSLLATYQREMEKLNRAKIDQKLNEYMGVVGDRVEMTVKCVGIRHTNGYYGTVTIHRMLSAEGHTLVWFSNAGSKMETGKSYTIRAQIKKHDEYNNWKQTVLTRVKVVNELENGNENG